MNTSLSVSELVVDVEEDKSIGPSSSASPSLPMLPLLMLPLVCIALFSSPCPLWCLSSDAN